MGVLFNTIHSSFVEGRQGLLKGLPAYLLGANELIPACRRVVLVVLHNSCIESLRGENEGVLFEKLAVINFNKKSGQSAGKQKQPSALNGSST